MNVWKIIEAVVFAIMLVVLVMAIVYHKDKIDQTVSSGEFYGN